MASPKTTPKIVTKSFAAILERAPRMPNWVIVRLPLDVGKIWGVRGHLKVKGEINGFAFASALFPTREGWHFLIVNKRMQTGAKATPGVKARFRIGPDTALRKFVAAAELLRELRQSKRLQKYHDALSPSTRNDIAKWISEGKQSETRVRRAQQLAERLMLTMEAEREPPPIMQVARSRGRLRSTSFASETAPQARSDYARRIRLRLRLSVQASSMISPIISAYDRPDFLADI